MSTKILHIENLLKNLPSTPWVYQMKDAMGKVIYVWKSINLKSRVSSYFRDKGGLTLAKKQMVGKIIDIETILCESEVEALVLETNLIKHLTPKYNILMKDDKNLAYIKITPWPVPEIIKTRQKSQDGWLYFGPYTQWSNIYECVKQLKRIFRIRNCKMRFGVDARTKKLEVTYTAGRAIPCMDYYIWLCPWPCLLDPEKIDAHSENVLHMKEFLRWEHLSIIDTLKSKMQAHAKQLEFEEAQKIKILLDAIWHISEKQLARDALPWDHDIFVMLEKYEKLYVWVLQVRNGHIIGIFRHTIEGSLDTRDDMIVQFLARQYIVSDDTTTLSLPDSIILTTEIQDHALLSFFAEKNIFLNMNPVWVRKELFDFAQNQLREYAYKSELATLEQKTLTRAHMETILTRLGYSLPKKWEIIFECYDISHTHGQFTYASRVLISNGKPDTSRYKKYKIKTLSDGMIDDFASHREVMTRRIIEGMEYGNLPHLIIIDGGKWQLSSALRWLQDGLYIYYKKDTSLSDTDIRERLDIFLSTFPLCSIAKREEEVFVPRDKVPILFEHGSPELMVLQKARDESHRFSITANRSARMKSMKKNILEELPWFGPVTRKKLLTLAGSIDDIKNLSIADLESICSKSQIQTLRDHGLLS